MEGIWIFSWGVVGGLLAWRFREKTVYLLPLGTVVVGILYGCCFVLLLTQGCWIPVVPSALALITTSGILSAWRTLYK